MKHLMVIILLLFTLTSTAQKEQKRKTDRKEIAQFKKDMSPQDIASLKSKKMTLHLDLTDGQQQQVYNLILAKVKKIKAFREKRSAKNGGKKTRPTKDELVKKYNKKLDHQIVFKREMKQILTLKQYERFEKMRSKRGREKRKRKGKY